MKSHAPRTYLSPTSGIDGRGVSDMTERSQAARDGSMRLLAAIHRYFERHHPEAIREIRSAIA